MTRYRQALPQLADQLFLTDGGLETTLIFHEGVELPHFAAFDLLRSREGWERLEAYYDRYARLATAAGLGFVLESPTWRANPDWGARLDYSRAELADLNRDALQLMAELRERHASKRSPFVISGNIGPRGDGYAPGRMMSAEEAEAYHGWQVRVFKETEADMVAGFTLSYAQEAIGLARAAEKAGLPVAISFTLETDGRLPSGQSLKGAIETVDAETGSAPAYYMINCAHPTHLAGPLARREPWLERLRGLRANASMRSHAELDAGDPVELGRQYRELRRRLPRLTVLGGCCGTDHRHVEQICHACAPRAVAA